nr:immunoglobulin heavy chain junction region [Macaca mulatta]MOX94714.1 immunoglobulin heavy chain junction region [Macaca mulatta]MOX95100.1 immunoglobulin heavy chain junction region [Macaca mulatta]
CTTLNMNYYDVGFYTGSLDYW